MPSGPVRAFESEAHTHELKVWPEFFDALESGAKSFEIRKDDREPRFAEGQTLRLREWSAQGRDAHRPDGGYTGREVTRTVSYVTRHPAFVPSGFCVMGLAFAPRAERPAASEKLSEEETKIAMRAFYDTLKKCDDIDAVTAAIETVLIRRSRPSQERE